MQSILKLSEDYRSSLDSLKPLIVIVIIINGIFLLQFYYDDSILMYIFLNLILLVMISIFLVIKITLYFKDRKKQKVIQFGPGSPEAKSFIYSVTQEMKGWMYYFNPNNLNYLVEFYVGSHSIGYLLRWCSSLGFLVVWINGYFIKKVLKSVYGMTLGDLRVKLINKIKGYEYLLPRYQIKSQEKVE